MITIIRYLAIVLILAMLLGATSAQFPRDKTKDIIFDITGKFEGGKADSLQTNDDGIISYGIHQATLGSGSLNDVLKRYTELSQTLTSKQIATYLTRVKSKDSTLKSDTAFLKLLKDAASESDMEQAQNEVFSQKYYEPAMKDAATDEVNSALGMAIYYDTEIHGGLDTVRKATKEHFSQGTHTEKEWLSVFLDERRIYLLAVAESKRKKVSDPTAERTAKMLETSASSKGRVGILQGLVNAGNLDLKQGDANAQISMGNFGKVSSINSEERNYLCHILGTIPIPTGPAADALKEQGKYEEYMLDALQATEKRIRENPQDEDAWYTKSLALKALNRNTDADYALYKASEAWNTKGIALANQGNYDEAIKAFDEAINLNPEYVEAWNNKGKTLNSQGNRLLALQCFSEAKTLAQQEERGKSSAYSKPNQLSGTQFTDYTSILDSNMWTPDWATRGSGCVGRPAAGKQQPSGSQQNTQDMSDEEKIREAKRRIEKWFAAGAPGLS